MSDDQERIQELLGELEIIHTMILPLREEVAELQSELEMVQGEYDNRLGALNRERAKLEPEREYLQAKLLNEESPPPTLPPAKAPPSIIAPDFDEEIIELPGIPTSLDNGSNEKDQNEEDRQKGPDKPRGHSAGSFIC